MENPTNRNSGSHIADELGKLGENMARLFQGLWSNSDERKYVEGELRSGIEQFNKRMNVALDQLNLEENARKARDTARTAWETARGPQIASEVRQGVADSLRKFNDELAKRSTAKGAHEAKADETIIDQ